MTWFQCSFFEQSHGLIISPNMVILVRCWCFILFGEKASSTVFRRGTNIREMQIVGTGTGMVVLAIDGMQNTVDPFVHELPASKGCPICDQVSWKGSPRANTRCSLPAEGCCWLGCLTDGPIGKTHFLSGASQADLEVICAGVGRVSCMSFPV